MGKKVKEFVTYWGPSINEWGDGTEKRFVIERDEDLLKQGVESGGRRMEKISLNDIFKEGVVTGVDMVNGYMPLVLYANDDLIIEVANCDREQGGWHRNMGADEWVFQYNRFKSSIACVILRWRDCCIRSTLFMHSTALLARNVSESTAATPL